MKNLILLSAFLVSNLLCSQSNSLPQSIPTDGLYGYWPLDGNINDLSGNANDGSTDGTFTTDAFENEDAAVYLNNQLIILPVNDQLNVENFTIQFWTKAVSYNIHNKVQIADPSGPWRWAINWADSVSPLYGGHFLYYTPGECDGSYADSGNNINNLVSIDRNVWHSLTVVVEGQQTSFYKDGNLITVSNESSNLTCFNDDMNIYFGGDVPGAIEYYNGWFDNIAIWTRALNSDEVELIYSSTQNGNQCSEASINASATEVCAGESVDLSVNVIGSNFSNWNTNEPNNNNGDEHVGMLIDTAKWNDHRSSNSNPDFLMECDTDLGVLSGFNFLGDFEGHFYYQSTTNSTWTNANSTATSLGGYLLIINSQAENDFIAQTSNITVHGSWIGMYQDTNHPDYSEPGGAWFWGDGTAVTMSSNPPTYTWSTGDTTTNISVTPTETTEYWVDVTTNGVTCREYVTIDVTAPAAPTGNAEQTFCDVATIADLTATGDNIQWYDAATGGNLLDSTTALTNGQMVYASQTVNGCESTDRLEVTVSIQDITITASATEVCAGESVDLTVSSGLTAGTTACTSADLPANLQTGLVGYWPFCGNANDESGNGNNGTVNGATLTTDRFGNTDSAYSFDGGYIITSNNTFDNGWNEKTISIWVKPNNLTNYNQTIYITPGHNGESLSFNHANSPGGFSFWKNSDINVLSWDIFLANPLDYNFNNLSEWINIVITQQDFVFDFYINGSPDTELLANQNALQQLTGIMIGWSQSGSEYFNGDLDDLAIWNRALTPSEIQQLANSSTYNWSTGDTTANISVTPTETTEYWVDVTTNGVTCREYVTIDVTAPAAPTADAEQTFCNSATVADLIAAGDNIQWYDAATGGNLLNSTTVLTDGQMVYASQTVNGCESTDRLEVTVSIQDITITASATEVCAGESVDLTVSSGLTAGLSLDQFQQNNPDLILFHTIGNHSYFFKNEAVTWPQAKSFGDQIGVSMYVINNAAEELSVYNELPFTGTDGIQYWLGLYQDLLSADYSEPSGAWKWVDNSPLQYTNWAYLEPSNGFNNEDFAQFEWYDDGIEWNDAGNNENNNSCQCNVAFPIYEYIVNSSILWSTGESTANISVTPSETTEYWVDVTTNGVTCREYVTINVTAPAAPTGDAEQTFCTSSTVADLTATGDNIQWYDAATGGNLLNSTTVLTDGQMVYASQTVNGCESTDRLEVTVSIQDITITTSATEVCAGESVDLTVSSGTTSFVEGSLVGELNHTITTNIEQNFATQIGLNYRLEITGNFSWGTYCPNLAWDPAYTLTGFYGAQEPTPREMLCDSGVYSSIFCDTPGLRPIPDVYNDLDHTYNYYFVANSNSINVGFQDGNALGDNCGTIRYRLYENSTPANSSTYTWSTGDTTANISVTPTETTEYWVDVTTNGVTCREYVTINVSAPAAPTGPLTQTFCDAATVGDLTATGDNIQWYDAATGGNLLDSATALTDGQMVYASQTVNGCESTDRLEVSVSIQEITITASATEVCAGESVDLSVVGDINSTYLWSTGESNFSGQGTLIDEYSLIANTVSQNTFSTIPGNNYRLEVSGTISLGGGAGNQRDVAYYIQSGSDGTTEGTPFDSACNLRIWTSLFCDTPGLRPSPDIYDASTHTYSYPFTANSSTLDVGFWDSPLGDNGPNVVTFKLYELSNSESTITVSPTETTEYWVDVTTNGVTCREYVTIDVTAPAAPTGDPVQGGCSDFTVGSNNNAFTGENLQWYSTPSGGNALPDSHLLVDGTYYYISQTVDGCESSDRFEFLYLAPDPTITIDSPVICEGDSTTVSVSSSPSQGSTTFLWNTGETSESITLSPTESTTFWVDQIYNSGGPENIQTVCRYFFGITVDNAPEAPISGGDISECETITAQSLVATASADPGESITWYDAATGGSIVVDPSLSAAGTVTYYAEAINDTSGCASLTRTAVTLTITSVAAPTGDAVQSFCDNVNVSDLSVSGSNIQWYDAATGGNLLDPSSALSDGQLLYASQTENSCESITRLEVSVEIDIIPDPILITTELEFCLAREATLADLEVDEQGFALEWYDSFSGGNMLPMDTLLEDGVSYYATLYDATSGCESLMRLEVVPTVIPCEVVIYNAISLNDNGVNDYMVIENVEYFPDNSLEVYNRDGHLLYSQTQYGMGGNLFRGKANVSGIYNKNSNLPTGSYLYVFKYFNPYEQQQYTLKGFLTINSN